MKYFLYVGSIVFGFACVTLIRRDIGVLAFLGVIGLAQSFETLKASSRCISGRHEWKLQAPGVRQCDHCGEWEGLTDEPLTIVE